MQCDWSIWLYESGWEVVSDFRGRQKIRLEKYDGICINMSPSQENNGRRQRESENTRTKGLASAPSLSNYMNQQL